VRIVVGCVAAVVAAPACWYPLRNVAVDYGYASGKRWGQVGPPPAQQEKRLQCCSGSRNRWRGSPSCCTTCGFREEDDPEHKSINGDDERVNVGFSGSDCRARVSRELEGSAERR
jgi:hypothetical protein